MTDVIVRPANPPSAPHRLRLPRLRLLPAVIFTAVLMIGVRFGDLWDGLSGLDVAAVQSSLAQDQGLTASDPVDPVEDVAAGSDDPEPAEAGPATEFAAFDLDEMTRSEWEVLQQLSERRAALDRRERDLDHRDQLVAVAERRLEEKMRELEQLRGRIEAMLGQIDEDREAQILGLVSIYESMRPSDAASIFNGLEMEILIDVVERMRGQKSAPILAAMNPERARQVTTELAQRQQLPDLE